MWGWWWWGDTVCLFVCLIVLFVFGVVLGGFGVMWLMGWWVGCFVGGYEWVMFYVVCFGWVGCVGVGMLGFAGRGMRQG